MVIESNNLVLTKSPVHQVDFKGHRFHIKRDDLLHPLFSGNKARKFYHFIDQLKQNIELPEGARIKRIVGYGSVQANSLLSLSALAHLFNLDLDYYCVSIPQWLKANPIGNYKEALRLGANIIQVEKHNVETNLNDYMTSATSTFDENTLFMPEGGRCEFAETGIKSLADELVDYINQQPLKSPLIMLPAGTGTTALYLNKHLPHKVVTCPCVGDSVYLRKQFSQLEPDDRLWPEVIESDKKYHFGKLYPELFEIWKSLKSETNITFDLLYDPFGWLTLLRFLQDANTDHDVIYIHQGGLVGNESMLPRYERKFRRLTN